MRDFLTGLAIILIIALTSALVAPYFIDWTGQRAFLEARLTRALGEKVTIGGGIDLKLLPTPYLILDQTVIGGDEGPIRMGIRHLDLQLSITPLLHGEFEVTQAQLRAPTLRITLDDNRALPALPKAPAFEADLRFDHIQVEDGTIIVADPQSGRNLVFDGLDFTADAPSIAGPFKGSGKAGRPEARTAFRFATTAAQKGSAHLHAIVEETAGHPGLDLDGTATLALSGAGAAAPSFDGMIALTNHVDDTRGTPIPWRLSGPVELDPQHAVLTGGELRVGGEAGLSLQADGHIDIGDAPASALALAAKQLDIDRLSGAPTDATPPPPPKLPDGATVRAFVAAAMPILPASLSVAVEAASYGGETLNDVSLKLDRTAKGDGTLAVSGAGPGGVDLAFDGRLSGDGDVDGRFRFGARDMPAAVAWLAAVAPDLAPAKTNVPFDIVKATGHVISRPDGVSANDLRMSVGRSELAGIATFAQPSSSRPASLTLRLTSDALDLDAVPRLDALSGSLAPFDLDLDLDAKTIKFSQFGDSSLDAGRIRVALTKSGRHVVVRDFRADDLGGATIVGTGTFDPDKASLSAKVDAEKLAETADLVKRLVPGWIADGLVARASALAPAKLAIVAAFAASEATAEKGALTATRVDLGGTLGATTLEWHLAPDAEQAGAVAMTASAEAPDAGTLLQQLGFRTLPLGLLGHGRVSLSTRGIPGQPLETSAEGQFGGTRFASSGRFRLVGDARGGSGTLTVKSDDVGPLLQSLALAFPDMLGRLPVDIGGAVAVVPSGVALTDIEGTIDGLSTNGTLKWQPSSRDAPALTGAIDIDHLSVPALFGLALGPPQAAAADAWFSDQAFGTGLVDPPTTLLKIKAKALDLGLGRSARDAAFDLGIAANTISLRGVSASVGGGSISGEATLRRDGAQAALEGKVGAKNVALDLPGLSGRLSGRLDLAGSGGSALALVGSFAGSGVATIAGMTIPRADPAALPLVFNAVESDAVSVDQESIVRALDGAIKGPLDAGARAFRLGLASGVVHAEATDAPVITGPVESTADLALDLRKGHLAETATETLKALPKGWTGAPPSIAIDWSGPVEAPSRSVDVGNFLDAVAARALTRETARIEAYEFDIRERAFFNARLQSERRRDEDRLKAEDDARKAEAARIAARKAAEERAAQERAAQEKATQDRATQDRATQDRATKEKAAQQPAQPPLPPTGADPPAGAQ